MSPRSAVSLAVVALLVASCMGSGGPGSTASGGGASGASPSVGATSAPISAPPATENVPQTEAPTPLETQGPTSAPTPAPTSAPTSWPPVQVYAATIGGVVPAKWAAMPERVYVPDEKSANVLVINPATFGIVGKFSVGSYPEHITPGWDGQALFVENMLSGYLTEINPYTSQPNGVRISVPNPYNLYFTPDGTRAIVVEDEVHGWPTNPNGLLFLDRTTWKKVGFVGIPWPGANHLDFSADGKVLLVSTEYGGRIVAVDVNKMKIISALDVGGSPTDVRLSPDGEVIFVANQGRNGIDVVDAHTLQYLSFISCGAGAHGLALSRDATRLFVTNRWAGTLSVISVATRKVVATWDIGGTPDMIAVSPDGSQLWISNRYSGSLTVVNSANGAVIRVIATGINPHGLAYWPEPGRYSLGHNGNMR